MEPIANQYSQYTSHQEEVLYKLGKLSNTVSQLSSVLLPQEHPPKLAIKIERNHIKNITAFDYQQFIQKIIQSLKLYRDKFSNTNTAQQLEEYFGEIVQKPLPQEDLVLQTLKEKISKTKQLFKEVLRTERPYKRQKSSYENKDTSLPLKENSARRGKIQRAHKNVTSGQSISLSHKLLFPGETSRILAPQLGNASTELSEGTQKVRTLLETKQIPISQHLLYHLVGDAIGTTSEEFTGYDQNCAWDELCNMMDLVTCFGDEEFYKAVMKEKTLLQEGNDFVKKLLKTTQEDTEALSQAFSTKLSSLRFVIPGGWKNREGGHAVVFVFEPSQKIQGKYRLTIVNTGCGIQYHPTRSVEGRRQTSSLIIDNISKQTIVSQAFLTALREIQSPREWTDMHLYKIIVASLEGTIEEKNISWGEIQRSGTCAFASLFGYLKYAMPGQMAEKLHIALGLKALVCFTRDERNCADRASCSLAKRCCQYYAQMVLEAYSQEAISQDEFISIQNELQNIDDHLLQRERKRCIEQQSFTSHLPPSRRAVEYIPGATWFGNLLFGQTEPDYVSQKCKIVLPSADPFFTNILPSYKKPFDQTKGVSYFSALFPPVDLSNPQSIFSSLQKVIAWAKANQLQALYIENFGEIEVFSRKLLAACKENKDLFSIQEDGLIRSIISNSSLLAEIFVDSFLKAAKEHSLPIILTPTLLSLMTNLICSVKIAGSRFEEIQRYPVGIANYAPGEAASEEYAVEYSLFQNFEDFNLKPTNFSINELETTIDISTGSKCPVNQFLDFLHGKYGQSLYQELSKTPNFSEEYGNCDGKVHAALALSKKYSFAGKTVFPQEMLDFIHLDNLVYFLQQCNRAPHEESPSCIEPVEWIVEYSKSKWKIVKPEKIQLKHPSDDYAPARVCPCEFVDSEAVLKANLTDKDPHTYDTQEDIFVTLQRLSENSCRIDLVLTLFSSHPEYLKDPHKRSLLENILFQLMALQKTITDPVLKTTPKRIIDFLNHQMNLALLEKNADVSLFLLRQYRMFYERCIVDGNILLPKECVLLKDIISKNFELTKIFFSSEKKYRVTWNFEQVFFLNVHKKLSLFEIDQLIIATQICRREIPLLLPSMEFEIVAVTHEVLSRNDVKERLNDLPDEIINKCILLDKENRSWKKIGPCAFFSPNLPELEFHMSTGWLFERQSGAHVVETPIHLLRNAQILSATNNRIPSCMKQEKEGVFSFEIDNIPFRIETEDYQIFIYKNIKQSWCQFVRKQEKSSLSVLIDWISNTNNVIIDWMFNLKPVNPKISFPTQEMLQHTFWLYNQGQSIRVENTEGVVLFEGDKSKWSSSWIIYECNKAGQRTPNKLLTGNSLPLFLKEFEEEGFIQKFSSKNTVEKIRFSRLGEKGLTFIFDEKSHVFRNEAQPDQFLLRDQYVPGLGGHKLVVYNEKTKQRSVIIPAHKIGTPIDAKKTFIEGLVEKRKEVGPFETSPGLQKHDKQPLRLFTYVKQKDLLIPEGTDGTIYLAYSYLWQQEYEKSARTLNQLVVLPLSPDAKNFLNWMLRDTEHDQDIRALTIRLKALAILKKNSFLFENEQGYVLDKDMQSTYSQWEHLCGIITLSDDERRILTPPSFFGRPSTAVPTSISIYQDRFYLPSSLYNEKRSILDPYLDEKSFTTLFSIIRGGESSIHDNWGVVRSLIGLFGITLKQDDSAPLDSIKNILHIAARSSSSDQAVACAVLLATLLSPQSFSSVQENAFAEMVSITKKILTNIFSQKSPLLLSPPIITEKPIDTPSPMEEDIGIICIKDPVQRIVLQQEMNVFSFSPLPFSSNMARSFTTQVTQYIYDTSPIANKARADFTSAVDTYVEGSTVPCTLTVNQHTLSEYAQKLEDTSVKVALKEQKQKIHFLLSKQSTDIHQRAIHKAMRLAGYCAYPNIQDAVNALLMAFPNGFVRLNPALSHEEIIELRTATMNYLLYKTYQQHVNKVSQEISKVLRTVKNGELPSQDALQLLFSLLTTKRNYEPAQEPFLLVFESIFEHILRKEQVEVFRKFVSGNAAATSKVIEMIMAAGKTSVLVPLISYMIAQRGKVSAVVLPHHLFPSMAPQIAHTLQKSFSIKVASWQLSENKKISIETLSQIDHELQRAQSEHGVILLSPKDITGLYLQLIASIKELPNLQALQQVKLLRSICTTLTTNTEFLFDEVDSTWNVLKEHLLSTVGLEPLDKTTIEVTCFLHEALVQISQKIATVEEFREKISPLLVHKFVDFITSANTVSQSDLGSIYNYVSGKISKEAISHLPHHIKESSSVARAQIQDILPDTYTKVLNVHYGRNPEIPSQQISYSIPYEQGIPIQARFGHDLEEVNFTTQIYCAMNPDQWTPLIAQFLEQIKTMAFKEIEENPYLSISKTKALADIKNIVGEELAVNAVNSPQINSKEIANLIERYPEKKLFFVKNIVLPTIQRPGSYFYASTQMYSLLAFLVRGFSGTVWNKETYPIPSSQVEESEESVGKTISIIAQGIQEVEVFSKTNLEKLYQKNCGIIDIGGFLREEDSQSVAQRILERSDPAVIEGVVFYDKNKIPQVLKREEGRFVVVPYESCTIPEEKKTAYWSQPFTFGSDLVIQRDAFCKVYISKDTILRDLLQGVWRLRKLGKGQKIQFVVDDETLRIVYSTLNLTKETPLKAEHIVAYVLKKQIEQQSSDNYRAFKHKAYAIIIQGFLNGLLHRDIDSLPELFEECKELFFNDKAKDLYDRYGTRSLEDPAQVLVQKHISHILESRACTYLCSKGLLDKSCVENELEKLKKMLTVLPEKITEIVPDTHSQVQITTQVQTKTETQTLTRTQETLRITSWLGSLAYRYPIESEFQSTITPNGFSIGSLFQPIEEVRKDNLRGACFSFKDLFSCSKKTKRFISLFPNTMGTTVNLHQAFQSSFDPFSTTSLPIAYALCIAKNNEHAFVLLRQEDMERIHTAATQGKIQSTPEFSVTLINIHTGATYPLGCSQSQAAEIEKDFIVLQERTISKLFSGNLRLTVHEKLAVLAWCAHLGEKSYSKVQYFIDNFARIHKGQENEISTLHSLLEDGGKAFVERVVSTLDKCISAEQLHQLQTQTPPYPAEFLELLRNLLFISST